MKVSDFDYPLPKELIAQEPLSERDESRMMVLQRGEGSVIHSRFRDLPGRLNAGDCLVLNDTKVIPARLRGRRTKTGGGVEILLLEPAAAQMDGVGLSETRVGESKCAQQEGASDFSLDGSRGSKSPGPKTPDSKTPDSKTLDSKTLDSDGVAWFALTQSRSALSDGEVIDIADGRLMAEVEETSENGTRLLRFKCAPESFPRLLEECGETPLPPYIRRAPSPEDAQRYQTVYAQEEGAVAAPTAGLHFSPQMLETLREKRVRLAVLTLHVGLGTFRPVKAENVEDHQMHSERFHLPEECAQAVNEARRDGKRIVAVGTTVVRVLEACADDEGRVTAQTGRTSLFVYPGHRFKVVDALLTNFHLPQSTLLMLVCAFAGTDFVLRAYRQAVAARYRFYSYGDCMLLLP